MVEILGCTLRIPLYFQLSFCAWIQTKDTFNYGSLLSYATQQTDNSFTFTDYNGFVLYINGENRITDIKIIDSIWHFICGEFKNSIKNSKVSKDYLFFGQCPGKVMQVSLKFTWMVN